MSDPKIKRHGIIIVDDPCANDPKRKEIPKERLDEIYRHVLDHVNSRGGKMFMIIPPMIRVSNKFFDDLKDEQ